MKVLYVILAKWLDKQLGRIPIQHIPSCAQLEKRPCKAGESLHNEPKNEHWWSGWPGAYCEKCGAEDKDEICIGDVCQCPCHADFWKSYEMAENQAQFLDILTRCYLVLSRPQKPPEDLMVDLHKCLDHFGRLE